MGNVVDISDSFKKQTDKNALQRHNVNFIIFSPEGKVYLFERFCKKSLAKTGQDNPNHPNVERWQDLPGGRVDDPETHISAIFRENIEELGIVVKALQHLTTMSNPTPGCKAGSTRSVYVVTEYIGVPLNKAGINEGHIRLKTVDPSEAADLVGDRIDDETRHFLKVMAPDYFRMFCRKNQTDLVQDNHPEQAIPTP